MINLKLNSTNIFYTKIYKIIIPIIGIIIGIIFLFPLYWLLMYSFKSNKEILIISWFPIYPTLQPWIVQIGDSEFLQSLKNSFIIAFISMSISFFFGLTSAYGIARFRFPGKNILTLTFLVTQMMPASLVLTPLYLIFVKLQLLNTYIAPPMAIATGSVPFIVITLCPYFMSLPKELDDASRIDGCGILQTFVLIMVPLIKAGMVTILVITFLHGWNDLIYSMTFNVSELMRPLTANISRFMNKYGIRWNAIMAYGMILVLPVTFAFVFLQKYIVGGLTEGAVKG